MTDRRIKQLMQVGADLQELAGRPNLCFRVANALVTAIGEINPDMLSTTIGWVAEMLRDKACIAACKGDKDLAAALHRACAMLSENCIAIAVRKGYYEENLSQGGWKGL